MDDMTTEAAITRAETFIDFAENYKRPFDYYKNSPDIEAIRTLIAVARTVSETGCRTMESAKRDGSPILSWCVHDADPYVEDQATGRLTTYGAHVEAMGHATDGFAIVEWGGEWSDEWSDVLGEGIPNWWFVVGSSFDVPANPVCWWSLPAPPASEGAVK